MRTCLLAFHVTEEYRQDEVVGVEFDQHLQHAAQFPCSVNDDAMITRGRKAMPGHLLNMEDEDGEDVIDDADDDDDITKDESRSTLDYRKAESVV